MRRSDREMPHDFALYVIDKSAYASLAVMGETYPYSIPLSIVRIDNQLYFHSATEGKKVELFSKEPKVCLSFVGDVKVPSVYDEEELAQIKVDPKQWSQLARNVFTTEFESAIVFGKIREVTESKEIRLALRAIVKKYTPEHMNLADQGIKAGIERVKVYAVSMDHVTAKRKRYDSEGKEMKNQRGWPQASDL
ncbi:MAG: pyridoxamine 5'-phosphate oxidase family protein [Clostridiaceae bacterium]|nr:pyridoxamine 5'-phosphate oxidase family protein [Clostridiaceae bacterium]